jgi:molybdopterin-containing oxidoreductase family membrane subunit
MPREPLLLASFQSPGSAARAIQGLRDAGCKGIRVVMPAHYESIAHALGHGPSPLGLFTFAGALLGTALGYALTIWTSLDWPMILSGKPIVSPVPYTVIAFESAVLIGALTNLAGVLVGAAWARRHPLPHAERFSGHRIGVFVPLADSGDAGRWSDLLKREGAEKVEQVDGA